MKPITSRIKRSPLFSYGESPMKQTATTGGTIEGEDKEIEVTETKEKPQVGAYRRACGSKTDGSTGTDPETGKKFKCAQAKKGEEPEETETVTTKKTVPGEDIDFDETLYTKKEDKVVQGPANTRKQERASTFINRKVNKYERQMGKYGTFDKEGNFTPDENLSQRQMRKLRQAQRNLEGAKAGRENVQSGIESGTGLKGKYYGGQREMDRGELDKSEQKEQAIREAKRERKRQADQAIDVMPVNPFANMATLNVPPIAAPSVNYMDLLKSSPGKMKKGYAQKAKSPATKALKGAQNTLPQHLQDAIKAAPGKMRGPLKKGYFKGM